ncbi:thiamine phosphate synthase [Thermomonas flagellata]|uniref:thiamine phosphate synthase n=1 Tax=Thermomonas flagellata TaxID=2888524 RepID=UPI001F03ABEE|nr:thiamine phosphate synthase [Thermomonas flagellata]
MPPLLRRGLYLITPDLADPAPLPARVAPLLPYAAVLQLRLKRAAAGAVAEVAHALAAQCRAAGVAFVVNDDPHLARAVGADGVHLGEHDGDLASARTLLGQAALIGVSCYDDLARAQRLADEGADYLAFGAFHPSPTKPQARRATPALLAAAAALGRPRVAIGGITPHNGRALVAAGADLLAVISGVFDADDPVAACRAYLTCFDEPTA